MSFISVGDLWKLFEYATGERNSIFRMFTPIKALIWRWNGWVPTRLTSYRLWIVRTCTGWKAS